ncbi:hypothetical protein [Dysgonomonas sp. HGC4]|uniref:hypothetical protein n=1 Tax=Dysgonomonas sp. HGC4 TaxID=1658009 RepID=UPI00068362A4|nr:hypothetical protein [Dysgonomonas sp. HGC4]MBD8347027.1 hypothetical protein [Dysgonomonas sp. HGC4]
MSNKEKNYPVISFKEYMMIVHKNEKYNGFVEYPDGIVAFVLTEVVVETIPSDNDLNRYTQYKMRTANKYHEQIITVNDAIKPNNQNINIRNKEYSQSIQEGRIKTAFRLKAEELNRKIKLDYTIKIIKDPHLKNDLDNLLAQYERLISCLDKNKPITLSIIPVDLRNTEQAQAYIKQFNITSSSPTAYITQGLTDYEQKQRNYQKAYDNWKNADPTASQAVEGMAYGMVGAPFAVGAVEAGGVYALSAGLRTALKLNTSMWGLKAGLSWGSQAWANGWREVNYVAVGGDAVLGVPLTGALVGGVIEWRPASERKDKVYIAGLNKGLGTVAIDVGTAFYFGKQNSIIRSAMPSGGNWQVNILYFTIDATHSLANYKFSSEINKQIQQDSINITK